jgi:hypothetical protein
MNVVNNLQSNPEGGLSSREAKRGKVPSIYGAPNFEIVCTNELNNVAMPRYGAVSGQVTDGFCAVEH